MKKINFYLLFLVSLILSCQSSDVNKNSQDDSKPYAQESLSTEKKLTYQSQMIPSEFVGSENKAYKSQGKKFAISTQGYYATQAAQEILNLKGNLIDAFVAASFVISVERPQSTGIGGGGFMIFKQAENAKILAYDFRERAPKKATRDMYLDKQGKALESLSKDGVMSVATPGLVKGLWDIHQKYGRLSWQKVITPAIFLAEKGFAIYPNLARALEERKDILKSFPGSRKIFIDKQGLPLREGQILVQKDLAKTLRKISKIGASEFYQGETSKKIISFMKNHKGLLEASDLHSYKVIEREPLVEKFKQYLLASMPPPSSGGVHVLQFLKLLEPFHFTPQDLNTDRLVHYQASAFQLAFADRAQYLGDPDFINVPTKTLLNEKYLKERRSQISSDKAKTVNQVSFGKIELSEEHHETTHLSLMDDEGNAISSTQTINGYFGSGAVAEGTGIILNNEMDDFSIKPGVPNLFGAVGSEANSIAAFKTPLSSMSPTLVLDEKQTPIMAVGAPGGTRIISCTALTLFNYLNLNMSLEDAVKNIRIHHQWKPDKLFIEAPGLRLSEMMKIKDRGYQVEVGNIPCRVMAVVRETFKESNSYRFTAVADPRDIGTALTGQ
ncbi:MAG: gamma-glutamyltransferase [Bdellovibrionaceae bacterium]|nr:gamma-glutamyltransferase [Pseudobdellovibrionaceae bacterium]